MLPLEPIHDPPFPLAVHERAALEAVRLACSIAEGVGTGPAPCAAVSKADASPVTVADFAVQCWIARALATSVPGIPLIGEESAEGLRRAGPEVLEAVHGALPEEGRPRHPEELHGWLEASAPVDPGNDWWLLDPIDGTKGFLRGEQYAICLALVRAGEPVFGLLACPALPERGVPGAGAARDGVVLMARTGSGAWQAGLRGDPRWRPVHCSSPNPDDRRVRVCESRDSAHGRHGLLDAALEGAALLPEAIRIDSQCKYALVARGDADIFVRLPRDSSYVEKSWDHAAGHVIATAAGARVSDLDGAPLDFSAGALMGGRGVLVASPARHAELLAALRAGATTGPG